ncbi:hypothetical protein H5U35_10405, partial [Candidatus Aerophobetes bacterium]|nr:hypothetical protein [Candidatus Aerophobetes bacterium]
MKRKDVIFLFFLLILLSLINQHSSFSKTFSQDFLDKLLLRKNTIFEYLASTEKTSYFEALESSAEKFDGEWERVVKDGIDDLNNDYAWAMSEYTDIYGRKWLYVGTLNTTATFPYTSQAKVYRSQDGKNWEYVRSFSGCSGVRGATEYGGLLWLGMLNSEAGCQVWITDGENWRQANQDGFGIEGKPRSTRGITCYRGDLYADAGQLESGESARIFKYTGPLTPGDINSIDPSRWEDVTPAWENPVNSISEMVQYHGDLYIGTFDKSIVGGAYSGLGCEVWRFDGDGTETWQRINEHGFGDTKNGAVLSMVVFKDKLYAGTQNFNLDKIDSLSDFADGAEIWRWDGESWECVVSNGNPGGKENRFDNMYIWRMIEYKDELVVGTMNLLRGGELWASPTGDAESFRLISDPGMRRDTRRVPVLFEYQGNDIRFNLSEQYGIRTVAKFNDILYVGTASWAAFVDLICWITLGLADPYAPEGTYPYSPKVGCEIWRIKNLSETSLALGPYPNPCSLSATGKLTIDRLPENATVYIYTISGELVKILSPSFPLTDRA